MSPEEIRANEIACQSSTSNWLTTLPLADNGFALTKHEFWDAVRLRYGWTLTRLPAACACGERFDLTHALSCKKGGFVVQRHNELRDLTANLLDKVCRDVCVEPALHELTGETMQNRTANTSSEARLDVSARGFWTNGQKAFFYIRVFDPLARKYKGQTLSQCYRTNEKEKKRAYNQRVLEVENGTFTPLVFSALGGMGTECTIFYKRLANMLAEKRNVKQSCASNWLHTKLSYALLRSALLCVRGSRHRYYKPTIAETDIELVMKESAIRSV